MTNRPMEMVLFPGMVRRGEFECLQERDVELPYATDGLLLAKCAQRSEERCRLIGLWNHHECLDRSGHGWASDRRSN